MAVTATQTPSTPFDQAYGANPITLQGIPTDPITGVITADKYVLKIFRAGTLIADIRQTPNAVGKAIFDIQNVLQNFVGPSQPDVEEIGYLGDTLRNSASESTSWYMQYGYEVGGLVTIAGTSDVFTTFGGTKEYFEVPYEPAPYIPVVNTTGAGCTFVTAQGQPFTDLQTYRMGSEILDGKPFWLTASMRVYDHYVTRDDMTTISYFSELGGLNTPPLANGIEAFVFWQYNDTTLISQDIVYNITSEGGGPNVQPGDGFQITYPNKAITLGTGPKNFQDFDTSSCTHYYVATSGYTECQTTMQGLTDESLHFVHRFNIIEEGCNDFPEYQFSWLNSYGFRDYYSFRKRKDRRLAINRNTYLQEAANYAADSYNVDIYNRGTTTYSQTIQEEYTAFTDFLTDAEALFLEGLFKSADVKVRFNDATGVQQYQWVPVTLLSNSYVEKTTRKDQLFQYDIKFKIAHNLKSQRG